jgi:hypothetical protein
MPIPNWGIIIGQFMIFSKNAPKPEVFITPKLRGGAPYELT